jgi:hypothetical protein
MIGQARQRGYARWNCSSVEDKLTMTAVLAVLATNGSSSLTFCRKVPLNEADSRWIARIEVCAAQRACSNLKTVRVDTNKRVPKS